MRDNQGGGESPTSRRLNVVVRSPPFYPRDGSKRRDNYPEGPDHPVNLMQENEENAHNAHRLFRSSIVSVVSNDNRILLREHVLKL